MHRVQSWWDPEAGALKDRISVLIRSPRRLPVLSTVWGQSENLALLSQEGSSHHPQITLVFAPGVPRIPVWGTGYEPPSLWRFFSWNGLRQWHKHMIFMRNVYHRLYIENYIPCRFHREYFFMVSTTPHSTNQFLNLIRGGNNASPTGINFMLITYVTDSHSCFTEARI